MNILIVGNGFDLSHYLPTKYDHFMVAMDAIENWDESQGDMTFDDLFCKDYWYKDKKTGEEYQNVFFQYTKAMYDTDAIKIPLTQVRELKKQLRENVWYQYFSDHVREVKTWIDFENKIEEVLLSFAHALPFIEKINYQSKFAFDHSYLENDLGKRNINILNKFNLFDRKGILVSISSRFCHGGADQNGVSPSLFLNHLSDHLSKFIETFNVYLELIISQLLPLEKFSIESEEWLSLDKIFSFNYTNTYQRIYDSKNVEYLHGSHGKSQNIVLGISDIENNSLKKIKAYGFTKYHQKLFKNTHYLFLSEMLEHFLATEKTKKTLEDEINSYLENPMLTTDLYFRAVFDAKRNDFMILSTSMEEKYNIIIWGHSLDRSDENYIKEIFSFNGELIEHHCDVIIFYFNEQAKFDLLNNLLDILGNKVVEKWMKKGWLQFKENPKIVAENPITLENLPKR